MSSALRLSRPESAPQHGLYGITRKLQRHSLHVVFPPDKYRDKPIERPTANEPSDFASSPITSSPRAFRGVHSRDSRRRGQTPAEKAQIDQALREIFEKLDDKGPSSGRFDLGPANIFDTTLRGRDATGLKPWSRDIRRGFDREENDDVVEALDELKEEVSAIQTDHELLDWARRRIFTAPSTPTPGSIFGEAGNIDNITTFPKTYPRILAHLMKVARQSFNNPHLSLSLFHHAQTLSPESYLSGCLSSAYTELIRTRWECFRDLDGVYRAIMEMDGNAVSWDKTTQREMGKIVEQVGRDVLVRGPGQWGPGVYEILHKLERKIQRSLRQSEYIEERNKRQRERRLWT